MGLPDRSPISDLLPGNDIHHLGLFPVSGHGRRPQFQSVDRRGLAVPRRSPLGPAAGVALAGVAAAALGVRRPRPACLAPAAGAGCRRRRRASPRRSASARSRRRPQSSAMSWPAAHPPPIVHSNVTLMCQAPAGAGDACVCPSDQRGPANPAMPMQASAGHGSCLWSALVMRAPSWRRGAGAPTRLRSSITQPATCLLSPASVR